MKPELELDGDLRILARWYDLRANRIAVSPDSRFALFTQGLGRYVAQLLPLTGGPVRTPPFEIEAHSVSFAPDGVAAIGGWLAEKRPAIVFWDVDADDELSRHASSHVLRHVDARSFLSVRYAAGPPFIERWVRGAAHAELTRELRMGREVQIDPDRYREEKWEIDQPEAPVFATPAGRVITCLSELTGGGSAASLFEWNLEGGEPRRLRNIATAFGAGDSAHPIPGDRVLVNKTWGEWWIAVWDLAAEREVWRIEPGNTNAAFAVDASGSRAVIVKAQGRIEVLDTDDGKVLVGARILPHRFLGVSSLAFTPDGRLLMGLDDGILALIEIP